MAGTRQFDEASVLDKALQLFWRKGYQATSMIDLAKETGVQRGSLYNAYNDKSTVFLKAFESYSSKLLGQMSDSLSHSDLRVALTELFDSMTHRLCNNPDINGCLSTRAIMEVNHKDECIKKKLAELLNGMEDIIQQRLELAKKAGQFSGSSQDVARYLVALSRGGAVIERVYSDEARIKTMYGTAIDMLLFNEH